MKISIPTEFADLTLREYNAMQKALQSKKPNLLKAISIALRCDEKDLKKATRASLHKAMKELDWMFEKPDVENIELIPRFWMHGIEYGFLPNMKKLTVGEFADIEHFTTQGTYDHLSEIMGILYRPVTEAIGNHYAIESYDGYDWKPDLMLDMPVDVAISSIVFFYAHEQKLMSNMRSYSQKMLKEGKSIRSGDGTL